jgi:hypothetical protein
MVDVYIKEIDVCDLVVSSIASIYLIYDVCCPIKLDIEQIQLFKKHVVEHILWSSRCYLLGSRVEPYYQDLEIK